MSGSEAPTSRRERFFDSLLWERIKAMPALIATGIGMLLLVGASSVDRWVCTDQQGHVATKKWGLDPLGWFIATVNKDGQYCEGETGTQFLFGKVPVVGESLERQAGGPISNDYYGH